MATFRFRAFDRSGAEITGDVAAATEAQAIEDLAQRGLAAFDLSTGGPADQVPWWKRDILVRQPRLTDPEVAEFARALGLMLRTGVPLAQSLSVAAESLSTDTLRRLCRRLEAALLRGQSMSAALVAEGRLVSFELVAVVRAGEAANRLGEALHEAALSHERRLGLRAKALAALAYPAFLVVAAVVVLLIVIFVLTPTLYGTFQSAGLPAGGLIEALEALRVRLVANAALVVIGLAALLLAVLLFGGRFWRGLRAVVPFLRRLTALGEYGRAARVLRTLLVAGERLEAALGSTATLASDPGARAVLTEAQALIFAGKPAGPLFLDSAAVPRLFARLYDLGERTDNLPDLLGLAADQLQADHGRALDRLTALITPTLTLLVGGVIATLVFVLLSAVLEVSRIAL